MSNKQSNSLPNFVKMPPGHIVKVEGEWELKLGQEWMNGPHSLKHYIGTVVYSTSLTPPIGYHSRNWIQEKAIEHDGIVVEIDLDIECWTIRDFNKTEMYEGGWFEDEIDWDTKKPSNWIELEIRIIKELKKLKYEKTESLF